MVAVRADPAHGAASAAAGPAAHQRILYPMASEAYKDELAEVAGLLRLIGRFDLLLTGKVVEQ